MTRDDHATGTDRLAEVADVLALSADTVVVNVQGDEPLIPSLVIQQVVEILGKHPKRRLPLCANRFIKRQISRTRIKSRWLRVSRVEPYIFPRARIPMNSSLECGVYYRHIGLYAYRAGFLRDFASWNPTPLEQFERLEQLRALEHDRVIQVEVAIESIPPGVDTESDLEVIRRQMEDLGV